MADLDLRRYWLDAVGDLFHSFLLSPGPEAVTVILFCASYLRTQHRGRDAVDVRLFQLSFLSPVTTASQNGGREIRKGSGVRR